MTEWKNCGRLVVLRLLLMNNVGECFPTTLSVLLCCTSELAEAWATNKMVNTGLQKHVLIWARYMKMWNHYYSYLWFTRASKKMCMYEPQTDPSQRDHKPTVPTLTTLKKHLPAKYKNSRDGSKIKHSQHEAVIKLPQSIKDTIRSWLLILTFAILMEQ